MSAQNACEVILMPALKVFEGVEERLCFMGRQDGVGDESDNADPRVNMVLGGRSASGQRLIYDESVTGKIRYDLDAMSTYAACGSILEHLQRLISAAEARTSAQTKILVDQAEGGCDTREAEGDLWRSVDNLLALRRQQMQAMAMLNAALNGGRR